MIDLVTRLAYDWGVRCFGKNHMHDKATRALRCLEEAMELAQALEVPREQAHRLVDYVYDRPVGDPLQEVGGTLITAIVLCKAIGFLPSDALELELRRCLDKSPEHFAARNAEKMRVELS